MRDIVTAVVQAGSGQVRSLPKEGLCLCRGREGLITRLKKSVDGFDHVWQRPLETRLPYPAVSLRRPAAF